MKTLILTSLLICNTIMSAAQNNELPGAKKKFNRYWALGIGSSGQSMYDEAISYVRYKGSGIAPSLGLIKSSEKKYRQFMVHPTFVKLKTKRSNELRAMEVSTTRFSANYQYLVKTKEWNNKMKLHAGGNISLLFNIKRAEQLDNSQFLYDYAIGIGPAAKLDKIFYWRKRDCTVSYNLLLPLLSHIARPYYLNRIEFIDPENNFMGDLLKNSNLVTVNKNLSIMSSVSLTYPLFNKNVVAIGYAWNFYKMKTINSVYGAEHLISIQFFSNY